MNEQQKIYLRRVVSNCLDYKPAERESRNQLKASRKQIQKNSSSYPFQFAEAITISDDQGLDILLSETRDASALEWGTVLRATSQGKVIDIAEILDPEFAEWAELVLDCQPYSIYIDDALAEKKGFNGCHHYHIRGAAENYAISDFDRIPGTARDWISLLTFNLPDGPEVVGFNRFSAFIPAWRKDPSRLVKASIRDILRYLKRYD